MTADVAEEMPAIQRDIPLENFMVSGSDDRLRGTFAALALETLERWTQGGCKEGCTCCRDWHPLKVGRGVRQVEGHPLNCRGSLSWVGTSREADITQGIGGIEETGNESFIE